MRIFNLFIILNVIICVGGVCSVPSAFAEFEQETAENCHSMDQHDNSASETLNIEEDFDAQSDITSTCCNEYLTNNQSDQYIKASFQEAPKSSVQKLIIQYCGNISHRAQRQHDPPDLQVLNSIFLI